MPRSDRIVDKTKEEIFWFTGKHFVHMLFTSLKGQLFQHFFSQSDLAFIEIHTHTG